MIRIGTVTEIWRYPVKSMGGELVDEAVLGPLGLPGDRGWAVRDEAAGEVRGAKKLPALMRCAARYLEEPTPGRVPPAEITLPDGARVRTDASDVRERLSALCGRTLTLWPLQPAEARDHYRRGLPDVPDMDRELRQIFGRLEDEPLPDLSVFSPELFEFTSPPGTYFDALPLHLLTTTTLAELAQHEGGTANFDRRRFRPNLLIALDDAPGGYPELTWCRRGVRIGAAEIAVAMPTPRCVMTTQPTADLPKDPAVLRTIVRHAAQNVGVYGTVASPGLVRRGDPVALV